MKLLRTNDVVALTGLSRTTIWRLERDGQFPPRKQITAAAVGWLEGDVRAWVDELPDADALRREVA